MSSAGIHRHLMAVKEESTPGGKKELLEALKLVHPMESEQVIKWVFDKRVTFGFNKKFPPRPAVPGSLDFDSQTTELLERLAARELTGKAAMDAVEAEFARLNEASSDLLVMILQKNLRAGFGDAVAIEVWGPVFPQFKVNLSHNFRDHAKKMPARAWADTKYDGVRGFYFSDSSNFFSRSGLPLTAPNDLKTLTAEFLTAIQLFGGCLEGVVVDCEITSLVGGFHHVVGAVHTTTAEPGSTDKSVGIRVIDVITRSEFDKGESELGWEERRGFLEEFFADPLSEPFRELIQLTEGEWVHSVQEVWRLFAKRLEQNHEGLIIKHPEGKWQGKRTYTWLKLKAEGKTEGVVLGINYGDPLGEFADTTGSVIVRLPSGKVTNVAGMSREMRDKLRDNLEAYREKVILDLEYHEETPDGDLRHGRVKKIRDDKPVEDLNHG